MSRMLLICNPTSRSSRGKKRWDFWISGLQAENISFDVVETEYVGHAIELAKNADAYETVVAVGGDGTINEVLDGVMQSKRSDVSMGVLYAGTSPDFCTFHGIPITPKEALQRLLNPNYG